MKLNLFPSIIAIIASALVAFGLYSWCRFEDMRLLVTIFGGVSLLLTGGTMLALSAEKPRATVNLRVASGVFAFLLLVSNAIFCAVTTFSMALYVLINGFLLLAWIIVLYALIKAYQKL